MTSTMHDHAGEPITKAPRLARSRRRVGPLGARLGVPLRALRPRRDDRHLRARRRRPTACHLLDMACGAGPRAPSRRCDRCHDGRNRCIGSRCIEIARDRNPDTDLRLGSMFELPWKDDVQVRRRDVNQWRVGRLRGQRSSRRTGCSAPDGTIGISFWGPGTPNDLRAVFQGVRTTRSRAALHQHEATQRHRRAGRRRDDAHRERLRRAGTRSTSRLGRSSGPTPRLAWRALSSVGPAVPALRHTDPAIVKRRRARSDSKHCRGDQRYVYRFRNDHHFVIARRVAS